MKPLDYLKNFSRLSKTDPNTFPTRIKISLITNFTDTVLKNMLAGVCLHEKVYPYIYIVPYKQYLFDLKNPRSELNSQNPDITFVFFDATPYKRSEFDSPKHFEETLRDVKRYCETSSGQVVMNTFVLSYRNAYGNIENSNSMLHLSQEYNAQLYALSKELQNLHIFDTNKLMHFIGEANSRDVRSLYGFDIPFTNEFTKSLAEEWFSYIRALIGKSKKCIVLDLDNTLWGGVVGEVGLRGIAIGPEYPGSAYLSFQHALLEFYNRGVLLAVVSKNNLEDAIEVFQKHPHMVLKEKHFAAMRINWEDKAKNIAEIANELNIGNFSHLFPRTFYPRGMVFYLSNNG